MFSSVDRVKAISIYNRNYEIIVGLLASILVFRKPATIGILIFLALNLVFYKNLKWNRNAVYAALIIALPFLLDLLFLWNNDVFLEGIKQMEKRLSLLLFPALLLFQKERYELERILKVYSIVFTLILASLFVRFVIVDFDLILKYLDGIHLWETGYSFAASMDVHAPAVNMHVAFLVIVNTYILFQNIKSARPNLIAVRMSLLLASIFFLLFLNTRIAVSIGLLGVLAIIVLESTKRLNKKQAITTAISSMVALVFIVTAFAKANPYMVEKYTSRTFGNLEMVGRLDEFDNPEGEVFGGLVTRVSIWKTAYERAQKDLWTGVGAADGKNELNKAYKNTNQLFLYKYKFPTHNQYLDFLLKFGILGLVAVISYMLHVLWLSIKLRSSVVFMFFVLFFICNLTDDFLIRFDGIAFSGLWISLFAGYYWLNHLGKDQLKQ